MKPEYTHCKDYKQLLWRLKGSNLFMIQLWGPGLWKYGAKIKFDKWEYWPCVTYSLDLFCLSIQYKTYARR